MSNSNNVRIRTMEPDDRDSIVSLVSRLEEVGLPSWRDAERMHAFHQHYADATVNASGPDEAVFVAEIAGKRCGVVHVLVSESGLTGERQGYVSMLAVSSEAAGQGVGRALMDAAESWCRDRGMQIIALDVFARNSGARAFYQRLGYLDETLTMIKELA